MYVVNVKDVKMEKLPGRYLGWIFKKESREHNNWSMCIIEVMPKESVRPAHSHPDADEIVYIIKGRGQVLIGDQVLEVCEGCTVFFPKNTVHMLKNTQEEKLKAVCFFVPATDYSEYRFFEEVDF